MIKPVIEIITRPVIFNFIDSFLKNHLKIISFAVWRRQFKNYSKAIHVIPEIQKFIERKVFLSTNATFH